MERRMTADRRLIHVFVADERRSGPYNRRGAETRHRERDAEKEKIERIRAFKKQSHPSRSATPLITKKRLIYLSLALLLIVVALFLRN
jgi:hypothetical protein